MRIDPATGVAAEAIDFDNLYPARPVSADVMNGIAIRFRHRSKAS